MAFHVAGVVFVCVVSVVTPDILVSSRLGNVKGFSAESIPEEKEYLAFTGIPYAKPPLGELRFQDPRPADPWPDVLDATKPAPRCLQYGMISGALEGQEDCLYLNIYTQDVDGRKAVMFWIHGGGWTSGSGNAADDLYGPEYLMNQDVVLVTINYRLNVFGFLSTGDGVAPGNYGLLDMLLALGWVRDNIRSFGGDPKKVTIFGESAGAAAVHLLMLSPRAQGLFQRAIAQSGSAFCAWAIEAGEWDTARKVGAYAGCPIEAREELLACLKKAPADVLVSSQKNLKVFSTTPFLLTPRIDTERDIPFLPDAPTALISSGRISDVPLLTGITKNEGYFMYARVEVLGDKGFPLLQEDPEKYLTAFLSLNYSIPAEMRKKAIDELLIHYLGKPGPVEADAALAFSQLISDRWSNKCFYDTIKMHSRHSRNPVFTYVYSHRGEVTVPGMLGAQNVPRDVVSHCDDLLSLFKPGHMLALQGDDIKMASIMTSLWVSFAQTGSPSTEGLPWSPITPNNYKFMELTTTPSMKEEEEYPFGDFAVWDRVLSYRNERPQENNREL